MNQVTGTPHCNDDSTNGPCTSTLQSHVQFNATAGVTYYIRVSGYLGSTGNFKLGVTVSGTAPFTYQWLLNGIPIPGAVNSTLTINPVTSTNLGNFSVSVANAYGQLDGTSAEVIVEPTYIPVITDASLADGWFRFMVETKIGFNYVIEYKNDLTDPTWTTLTNTLGIGAPSFIYDSEPHAQKRFYRVVQEPAAP